MTSHPRTATTDKNGPLIEDIRLLGRILGEVIRDTTAPRRTNWGSGSGN